MNQEDWPTKDYQTALSYIDEHEDEAASNIILPLDKGITAVLGLPLYGAGFYGIFMLSPIILFMLVTAYFMLVILTADSMEMQSQILFSGGCFFLLWALGKALQFLISTRELFPRKYFTTLSAKGVSSHYSKLHFPFHSKVILAWSDIETTRVYRSLFLAGLFAGFLKAHIVEITSKSGDILKIPFHVPSDQAISVADTILDLINQKMK
ncbi:MAG: hypothetical protein JKY23_04855 [Nitrospinaceae bacterium]|nr:hypothetical protein [Nitrospinaceae bacterium]